ncbi:MAG: PA14 domain-containing protein [Planctomycetota bacterium]
MHGKSPMILRPSARTAACLWTLVAAGGAALAAIPPPSETPARVLVSGRTSTAIDVKVVHVGQRIPKTYSGGKIKNTPGFSWWVSRHYAFKTDFDDRGARRYLTLLELAYPHYVELFGTELDGIGEKRMAVVYGSSRAQMEKAMASDLGYRWTFSGGGITLEGFFCAYQYPSGSLSYHKRYILLHECTHLYQMCLTGTSFSTPGWHTEGTADGLSSHVYDKGKKRLTVFVVDKAAIPNFLDQGLRAFKEKGGTFRKLHDEGGYGRGGGFVGVQYFMTDPHRAQLLRIWRDEMFRLAPRGDARTEVSARLLLGLFGSWDELDAGFKRWLDARRNTFHYVDWGWEQDSNTLWSYGWPQKGPLSRTDVNMPPGERPAYHPLTMDHPAAQMPPILGPVRRGVDEPSVGCVIDFSRNPNKGAAGIGLGVEGDDLALAFPEGTLFEDRAATKPGLATRAYRLGKVTGEGMRSEDVQSGKPLGRSVDRQVKLGLARSAARNLKERFVVEWKGWLKVDRAGECAFATASDDGSWLWVDGKLVVANGGNHGIVMKAGKVRLTRGVHPIRVRYFQGTGGRHMAAGMLEGDTPGYARVLIHASKELAIDGTDLGLGRKTLPIPGEVRAAMKEHGHRVGMTVKVARGALEVVLRAGRPDGMKEFTASLPVGGKAARKRLLTKPMTILAREGYHGVTPFFDDRRRMEPDLTVAAPPNRWRNPGDGQLYAVERACWRLGERAPGSLGALRKEMLGAAAGEPAAQRRALESYSRRAPGIVGDIRRAAAGAGLAGTTSADLAAADLAGVAISLEVTAGAGPGEVALRAELAPPLAGDARGTVRFVFDPPGAVERAPDPEDIRLGPGGKAVVKRVCRVAPRAGAFEVAAVAELRWSARRLALRSSRSLLTSIRRWWIIGPFANPGGHAADVKHPVEQRVLRGEKVDLSAEYPGKGGKTVRWRKVEGGAKLGVTSEHLVDLAERCGKEGNVAAYALAWLEAPAEREAVLALGSDDGVVVWLNGERLHANLVGRGYRPKSDRVPVRLKKGRNELLVKITQGGGDWSFCVHLEDATGGALTDVTASLEGGGE